MKEVLEHLGNVLYWGCSSIAVLFALAFPGTLIEALRNEHESAEIIFAVGIPLLISALLFWLFGRVCRYVLAGEKP